MTRAKTSGLALIIAVTTIGLLSSTVSFSNAANVQEENVPNWFKSVAGFWSEDEISSQEFLDGVEFLIGNNVIVVEGFEYAEAEEIAQIKPDEPESIETIKIPAEEKPGINEEPTDVAPKPLTGLVTPIHTTWDKDSHDYTLSEDWPHHTVIVEQNFVLTKTAVIHTIGSIHAETCPHCAEDDFVGWADIVLKIDGELKFKDGNWVGALHQDYNVNDYEGVTLVPVWTGKLEPGIHNIRIEVGPNSIYTHYCQDESGCALSTLIFE